MTSQEDKTMTIDLTPKQRSDLSWLLSVNAHRDVVKEHDAYQRLSEDPAFLAEDRAKFASNAEFYAGMLARLDDLQRIVDAAALAEVPM